MDGIKKVISQLSSTNNQASSKGASASTSNNATNASANVKSNAAGAAAVIQLNPSPQKSSSSEAPVRTYNEAKSLAKSIAGRLKGDEHGDITADTLKGLFQTQ